MLSYYGSSREGWVLSNYESSREGRVLSNYESSREGRVLSRWRKLVIFNTNRVLLCRYGSFRVVFGIGRGGWLSYE